MGVRILGYLDDLTVEVVSFMITITFLVSLVILKRLRRMQDAGLGDLVNLDRLIKAGLISITLPSLWTNCEVPFSFGGA